MFFAAAILNYALSSQKKIVAPIMDRESSFTIHGQIKGSRANKEESRQVVTLKIARFKGNPKSRNPETGIRNPESGIRNPESGIQK